MATASCPSCRLRFSASAAAYLGVCPQCGRPLQSFAGAEAVVGFSLFVLEDVPHELPEAVAVSIPSPDRAPDRR
jgi:predicted amidophosphoribosyltransferase